MPAVHATTDDKHSAYISAHEKEAPQAVRRRGPFGSSLVLVVVPAADRQLPRTAEGNQGGASHRPLHELRDSAGC